MKIPRQQVHRPVDAVARACTRGSGASRSSLTDGCYATPAHTDRVPRPGSAGYQAALDRCSAQLGSRSGGSGREAPARARAASPRAPRRAWLASAPASPEPGRVAAELEDAGFDLAGVGPDRRRRASAICRGPGARIDAIARGRIAALVSAWGLPQTRTRVWQIDVVEAEQRRSRSRSRRGSSPSARAPRSRDRRLLVERGGDQLGAAQRGHPRDRVGERRVERVGAVGEGVHRAGPQLRLGLAGHRLRVGDHQRRAHQRPTRGPRRPAGRRWMPVISAPDIVVGIAATRAPVTAAIAFAVSITRPPPRATRRGASDRVEQRGGGLGHPRRAATSCTAAGGARPAPARRRARRGVLSSSKDSMPCSASSSRRLRRRRRRGRRRRARRPARRSRRSPGRAVRGLTTGRRFGSTSARRCSKSGGSESFSPRCSSGSSTVKPGPERRDLEEHAARLAEVDRAEVEAVDHRGRRGRRPRSPARATPRARRSSRPRRRGGRCRRPAATRSAGGSS